MKEIPLTRGLVALVDDADFDWLNQWKWYANPSRGKFYASRNVSPGVKLGMHQALVPGAIQVDHEDGNSLNNQRYNLRSCNALQNQRKSKLRADTRTGFKGVGSVTPGKSWRARIRFSGMRKHLGVFPSPEEAARAYDKAATDKFGEFAKLNFPQIKERMPKPEKQRPEEGQNDRWPGEGRREVGEKITNEERDEKTTIPEIRPDAKRYDGPSNT